MSLNDVVTVNLVDQTVAPQASDFGTLAILSVNATWPDTSRTYSSIAGVLVDFPADSPEAIEASKAFGQKTSPSTIKIIRGTHMPTQQYTVGESAIRNSDSISYKINVLGQGVTHTTATYTSDGSASAAKIHNGLVTSLNTVIGKNYTAAFAPLPAFVDFNFTADSTTDHLTSAAHPLNTGDGPLQVQNSGGGLPGGLSAATNYYAIKIDANTFELASSLANALAGTQIDITTNGTGTQTLLHQGAQLSPILPFLVTATGAGNWFSLEVLDRTALSVTQTHVDPGVATDLAAIRLVDSGWFTFVTLYNSKALVLGAAAWAEAEGDVGYFAQVNDTTAVQTAVQAPPDGNHDTLQALEALAYNRTVGRGTLTGQRLRVGLERSDAADPRRFGELGQQGHGWRRRGEPDGDRGHESQGSQRELAVEPRRAHHHVGWHHRRR